MLAWCLTALSAQTGYICQILVVWVDESVFINHVEFTSLDLIKVIIHVKSSKTDDPQGLNNAFIKRLKFMLALPLCATYTYIFLSGKIPNSWRMANVTPVFKKGFSSEVSNYRPISLISCFIKIYERIVKEKMLQ